MAALSECEPLPRTDPSFDPSAAESPAEVRARAVAWCAEAAVSMVTTLLLRQASEAAEHQLLVREERALALSRLREVIATLAPGEQQLVQMHYAEGTSLDDIAARLGVSSRTLVRMHQRIRQRLARKLQQLGVDAPPPDSDEPDSL